MKIISAQNIIKLIVISLLLSVFSCKKAVISYQQKQMQQDILKNRRDLYKSAYGEIEDPEYELE